MSSKSLRNLRRRPNVAKNSPLFLRNKNTLSISSCFEFDSEVLQNDDICMQNKAVSRENIHDSVSNKRSIRIARESKKENCSARAASFEGSTSETDESYRNIAKKLSKKKGRKIRNTMHNISNQCTAEKETNIKVKPKRVKKNQGSQIVLAVDDILEDKKFSTSSTENKENETNGESTDIEMEQKKTQRKKKRGTKNHSENNGSQESNIHIPSSDELPKNKNQKRKKIVKQYDIKDMNLSTVTVNKDKSNESICNKNDTAANTQCETSMLMDSNSVKKNDTFEVNKTESTGKRSTFEIKRNSHLENNLECNKKNTGVYTHKFKNEIEKSSIWDNKRSKTSSNLSDEIFVSDKLVNESKDKSRSKGSTVTSLEGDDDVFCSTETSLEISFNKYPRKSTILDHLNVTQFGDRKKSFKKSSRGFSTGSDDEDNKLRFITLKRGCRTLVDWNTTNQKEKKHNSRGSKALISSSDLQEVLVSDIQRDEASKKENTFDFVTNASKDMIDDIDSVVLVNSFVDNVSIMPSQIIREATFTKEESVIESPYPRKSFRKTWSRVEKTPVFNTTWCDESMQKREVAANKSKSVIIITPPKRSPKPSNRSLRPNVSPVVQKRPKSVRIESPVNIPKIRMFSPLIVKKTPKPPPLTPNNSRSLIKSNLFLKSSPTSTSTPFPKKDANLLKKVLTKDRDEKDFMKSEGKRVKMPNFEKIHQRRFEKMENLEELQKRKAKRARCLLSGHKPPACTQPLETTEKESKKKLQFSPLKQRLSNNSLVNEAPTKTISKPFQHMLRKKTSIEKEKKQHEKPNNFLLKDSPMKASSKPLQHMLRKRVSLEKAKKKDQKSKLPIRKDCKPEKAQSQTQPVKNISRFGFKFPEMKTLTKQEQIIAVASKTKVAKNRLEQTRKEIQGVRSNRRFELLMKMRQKK